MTDSDLISRLQSDMQAAMKAGQKDRVSTLRMLLSEAKNADLQKPPSTPAKMVEGHARRLRKAREEYEKLGKADEVAKLSAEITSTGTGESAIVRSVRRVPVTTMVALSLGSETVGAAAA